MGTGASAPPSPENICSFNVTCRGKKVVARGAAPQRDEMLQQANSGPSQNNSRKCQTSVRELRPREVSSTFCGPPPPPISYRHMNSDRMKARTLRNNNALLCMHVDGCVLLPEPYLLCMVTNRPPEKHTEQTHRQPQNNCDSYKLNRNQGSHLNGEKTYVGAKNYKHKTQKSYSKMSYEFSLSTL